MSPGHGTINYASACKCPSSKYAIAFMLLIAISHYINSLARHSARHHEEIISLFLCVRVILIVFVFLPATAQTWEQKLCQLSWLLIIQLQRRVATRAEINGIELSQVRQLLFIYNWILVCFSYLHCPQKDFNWLCVRCLARKCSSRVAAAARSRWRLRDLLWLTKMSAISLFEELLRFCGLSADE